MILKVFASPSDPTQYVPFSNIDPYTAKTCRFHLRNISRIRKYIPQDISVVLIKSLVMSRLDYSNSLLYGLPKSTVSGLQAVQNSAARIVTQERLRYRYYTTMFVGLLVNKF